MQARARQRPFHPHWFDSRTESGSWSVYAGTKAAVLAISDGLRQELAGKVRVTVILPGYTNTDFPSHIRNPKLRAQMEHSREQFAMSPDTVARAIAYAICEPGDVNIGEIVVRPAAQP